MKPVYQIVDCPKCGWVADDFNIGISNRCPYCDYSMLRVRTVDTLTVARALDFLAKAAEDY